MANPLGYDVPNRQEQGGSLWRIVAGGQLVFDNGGVLDARLATLLLPGIGTVPSFGVPWYVSKLGNDNNAGSSISPYLTIGKALSVCNDDDVIMIGAGNYAESLTITRQRVALIGAKRFGCAGLTITSADPQGVNSLNNGTSVSSAGAGASGPALTVPDTINGFYCQDIDFFGGNAGTYQKLANITAVSCLAGIVTVTTGTAHGLIAGQNVVINGVGVAAYNTTAFKLAMVLTQNLDATHFSYALTSTPASSSGGQVILPTPAVKIIGAENGSSGSRREFIRCGFCSNAGPSFEVFGASRGDSWTECTFFGGGAFPLMNVNFKVTMRLAQGDTVGALTWAAGNWRFRDCVFQGGNSSRAFVEILEDTGAGVLLSQEPHDWVQMANFIDCRFTEDRTTYIYAPNTDAMKSYSFKGCSFGVDGPLLDSHIQLGYGAKNNGVTSRANLKGILPDCSAGSIYTIARPIVSNQIPDRLAGQFVIATVSTGYLEVLDVKLVTDFSGLAGAGNFRISSLFYFGDLPSRIDWQPDGPAWPANSGQSPNPTPAILEETVANLGGGKIVSMDFASVAKARVILGLGDQLIAQSTGGSTLTGTGVILVMVTVRRIHDLASIA